MKQWLAPVEGKRDDGGSKELRENDVGAKEPGSIYHDGKKAVSMHAESGKG